MEPIDIGFRPTIGDAIRRAAAEFGDVDYVVTLKDRLTYAEAEQASANLARRMLARGIGKGTRVGLFYPNGTDWVIAWLAASRIGAVVLPMSTLYAPGELRKVLRLGDVHVLLAPARVLKVDVPAFLEEALPGLAGHTRPDLRLPETPYLRSIWLDGARPRWAVPHALREEPTSVDVAADLLAAVEAQVFPADAALVIHTSGTTADPKGVVHSHGAVMRQTAIVPPAMRDMAPEGLAPKYLCAMPFFWIGGVLGAAGTLHAPVTLLVMERLEAGGALELLERERGTAVAGWPTFTQRMRLHPDFATRDLSSVPTLLEGPADIALLGTRDNVPRHRSMTETAGSFLTTDIAVVDENGEPVPVGEEGELLVRGPGLFSGYFRDPQATARVLRSGWLHTGDLAQRDATGYLRIVDRISDMFISGGENVSPSQVEATLQAHPAVLEAAVRGVPHPRWGEVGQAHVVLREGARASAEELIEHCRVRLARYKVPQRVVIVDELPRTDAGKIRRRDLPILEAHA